MKKKQSSNMAVWTHFEQWAMTYVKEEEMIKIDIWFLLFNLLFGWVVL